MQTPPPPPVVVAAALCGVCSSTSLSLKLETTPALGGAAGAALAASGLGAIGLGAIVGSRALQSPCDIDDIVACAPCLRRMQSPQSSSRVEVSRRCTSAIVPST
jgi:hypothetical protein